MQVPVDRPQSQTMQQFRSLISSQPSDAGICHRKGSTDCFPISTTPNESGDTLIIENELGNRAPDIHVAHERHCPVVENEPLMINTDCHHSMIFIWQTVPQYDDLHRI